MQVILAPFILIDCLNWKCSPQPHIFSYAGLHCVVIKGYSKSAGYQPGVKFEDNRFRNSWNAVYVAGAWRFVQCNWGARWCTSTHSFLPISPAPASALSSKGAFVNHQAVIHSDAGTW